MYLEELDESQQETVNDILSIIESNEVYQKQLDGNFNGLYYEDLSFQFYDEINNLSIDNFAIGDIVIPETVNIDIQTQEDLNDYLIYNITSINNNDFGNNKHIHIGGK